MQPRPQRLRQTQIEGVISRGNLRSVGWERSPSGRREFLQSSLIAQSPQSLSPPHPPSSAAPRGQKEASAPPPPKGNWPRRASSPPPSPSRSPAHRSAYLDSAWPPSPPSAAAQVSMHLLPSSASAPRPSPSPHPCLPSPPPPRRPALPPPPSAHCRS